MLVPSDYGLIAMLGIFFAISGCFIDSGFGTALVRKIDRTEEDFSTVFYFNIAVSVICYGLLWLAAPFVADFYNIPLLQSVLRVSGLNLIISAFAGIQGAKLSIDLNFKLRAKISIAVTVFTGVIGLYFAYTGYGVWALVYQSLGSALLNTILLWCFVRWMPQRLFSWKSFKELFTFGSKMLASALLDQTYNNIYPIVIGKCFSPTALGTYSRADAWSQFPSSNITGILQNVTFPVLSSIQNDEERLASVYKRFLRMAAFVVFPLMMGLSAVAEPMIRLVLTDKWIGSVVFLQIICFSMMWYPIHAINLNILIVKGRSDYFLKLEILKKIFGVAMLCVTIPLGLVAMCYGRIVTSILCLAINTYYTKKLIGYDFWMQIKDYSHIIILSLLMWVLVMFVVNAMPTLWLGLIAGILTGATFYLVIAYIFKFEELQDALSFVLKKNEESHA